MHFMAPFHTRNRLQQNNYIWTQSSVILLSEIHAVSPKSIGVARILSGEGGNFSSPKKLMTFFLVVALKTHSETT